MTKRVTVNFEDWLHKKLKIAAISEDLTLNDLIVSTCKTYLQEKHKNI